jgi:hypothetical protein
MASILGTPLPRQRTGHVYLFAAIGLAVVSSIGAFRGKYGWGLTEGALGITAFLYVLPFLGPRRRENVQVDDQGVIVVTDKGRDEVRWTAVSRARIITTSAGPWGEDVWFVLEGPEGKGCIVPHDAVVRTKLLAEMNARLPGIDDRKVIEAMGSTSDRTFVIWESATTVPNTAASNKEPRNAI